MMRIPAQPRLIGSEKFTSSLETQTSSVASKSPSRSAACQRRASAQAANHLYGFAGEFFQFGTGDAGTGTDGDGVHRGGGQHGKRGGIGIPFQFTLLAAPAEAGSEISIKGLDSLGETLANFGIFNRFSH